MALAPETPRRPRRRQTAHSPRTRSNTGKVLATLLAVGTTTGVGVGLLKPVAEAPKLVCGGTERWNIKSANDPDAAQINPNATGPYKVADLNKILPGPIDSGGRMAVEKKEYTVRGYLSYFKDETDDDLHVVITDKPGHFAPTKADPPNGRSMAV